MTHRMLTYSLVNGYLCNWLAAGPQPGTEEPADPAQLLAEQPVDRGPFAAAGLTWRYFRCMDDRMVDLSTLAPAPGAYQGWAYAEVTTETPAAVTLAVSAFGAAEVWWNNQPVLSLLGGGLETGRVGIQLEQQNSLLIRFGAAGVGPLRLAAAARLEAAEETLAGVRVQLATRARFPHRQTRFEETLQWAYLEEVVNRRGAHFNLRLSETALQAGADLRYAYQVQDAQGMIYVEGNNDVDSKPLDVGHTFRLYERPYRVVLRPTGKEYYEQNLRYQVDLPIMVLDNEYSTASYGSYESRRAELLEDAAKREGSVYYQAARMVVGKWQEVDAHAVLDALDGTDLERLGALGVLYRFGSQEQFAPSMAADMVAKLGDRSWNVTEGMPQSAAVVRLTSGLLAAQQRSDSALRETCAAALHSLLMQCGQRGFAEWNSDVAFERLVAALAHLVSYAEEASLRELAAVLLDKLLFLLAINSFQGVLGGTRGCTVPAAARSGQLTATAGIARLMFGMGVFTARAGGAVSLALSDYEYPAFFTELAVAQQPQSSRERHAGPQGDVNMVTYRTAEFLLSSAQDYRPGEPGVSEIAWGAVMGPDAVVFTCSPAGFRHDESAQPGLWLGNASLPRIAQRNDALIALYQLPDHAWLDFTHAFFPTFAFDEWGIDGNWAFARKGRAYLALTAAQPMEFIQRMPDGMRELRSAGRNNAWICQMGSAAVDGSFAMFQEKVKALPLAFEADGARFTTLRGEALALGWDSVFTVNGQEMPLSDFPHIEHPAGSAAFPAENLDITSGDLVMRLDFDEKGYKNT